MKSVILLLLFTLILNGCKSNPSRENIWQQNGGELTISCLASLENIDPQKIIFSTDWQVANHIYEGLTTIEGATFAVQPGLAVSWQKANSGERYVFNLADNVYFHDDPCFVNGVGRKMTAYDVVYTFERLANPETQSPNRYLFMDKISGFRAFAENKNDQITGITVIDSFTVAFELNDAYATFLILLSTPSTFIVPREAVEFYGEKFKQHPVGTGPFCLSQWKPLQELLLNRNERYWQKDSLGYRLPYLQKLTIKLISNPVLRMSEFLKGSLQVLKVSEKTYAEIKADENFKDALKLVQTQPSFTIRLLCFAMDQQITLNRDKELRKQLAHSFNRMQIWPNTDSDSQIAQTLVPDFLLQNPELKWYAFQQQQPFKNLQLKDSEIIIAANMEYPEVTALYETFANLKIPAQVDIRKVDYYESLSKNRPHAFRISFQPIYPDPEEYYALFYSKNPAEINLAAYQNKKFDQILERAIVEQDAQKRQALFLKLEQILKDDASVFYLKKAVPDYLLAAKQVEGLAANSFGLDLKRVHIKN